MTRVLLIAEHAAGALNPSTAKALACAVQIGPTDILVLGDSPEAVAAQAAALDGVEKVVSIANEANAQPLAAVLAPQIVELAAQYTHVLGPSTTFGKDLLPRVAALLDVPQVSDIMAVEGPYRFKRPIYAGNAIISVQAPENKKVVGTARTASFQAQGTNDPSPIESISSSAEIPNHSRYVKLEAAGGERPDLQSAPKVVSGGRALGSSEQFKLIYDLADKLGAGCGASRAAVDAGYVPNDMQVGQTGKIIAPDLYIAIGISGAIQHLTGIKDAGTIVAINKDPDAPIFEVADIGLVGDLFQLVPELMAALD